MSPPVCPHLTLANLRSTIKPVVPLGTCQFAFYRAFPDPAIGQLKADDVLDCFSGDLAGFIAHCAVKDLLATETISAELRDQWLDTAFNSHGRPNCVLPLEREHVADILDRSITHPLDRPPADDRM